MTDAPSTYAPIESISQEATKAASDILYFGIDGGSPLLVMFDQEIAYLSDYHNEAWVADLQKQLATAFDEFAESRVASLRKEINDMRHDLLITTMENESLKDTSYLNDIDGPIKCEHCRDMGGYFVDGGDGQDIEMNCPYCNPSVDLYAADKHMSDPYEPDF